MNVTYRILPPKWTRLGRAVTDLGIIDVAERQLECLQIFAVHAGATGERSAPARENIPWPQTGEEGGQRTAAALHRYALNPASFWVPLLKLLFACAAQPAA